MTDMYAIYVHSAELQTGITEWYITKFNYLHQSGSSIAV